MLLFIYFNSTLKLNTFFKCINPTMFSLCSSGIGFWSLVKAADHKYGLESTYTHKMIDKQRALPSGSAAS